MTKRSNLAKRRRTIVQGDINALMAQVQPANTGPSDTDLVRVIKEQMERVVGLMNAAKLRDIEVSFNVGQVSEADKSLTLKVFNAHKKIG